MCSLVLLFTISLQLVASYNKYIPSLLAFTSFLCIKFAVLQKPCQENFWKFPDFGDSRFGRSEKDRYFLKILKWEHKLVRDYQRGKLVSFFLNNAVKRCLYELKISEKLKLSMSRSLKHFFISVAIFRQVASAPLRINEQQHVCFINLHAENNWNLYFLKNWISACLF